MTQKAGKYAREPGPAKVMAGRIVTGPDLAPAAGSLPRGPDHVHDPEGSIFAYCPPELAGERYLIAGRPVLAFAPPGAALEEVLKDTGQIVVFGAAASPLLSDAAKRPGIRVLVFEPERAVFARFAKDNPGLTGTRDGPFYFAGDPDGMDAFLSRLIPPGTQDYGYPAVFVQSGLAGAHPGYLARVREKLEFLYYRTRIYPLCGRDGEGDLPARSITRELYFDQKLHLYKNAPKYLLAGSVDGLAGRFAGATAVLVAAGPQLSGKMEYLRQARENALIICVNKALRPLLMHGIEPHFAVITDNSRESAADLADVPDCPGTFLAANALAGTGAFDPSRIFFFGQVLPSLFGSRRELANHGSVITAAFSLACLLGCARAVLVGVQLASDNPFGLDYVKPGARRLIDPARLPGRYPQLYPVRLPDGRQAYTTLNFRDAALWFLETIAASPMEVVNTAADSLIHGGKVIVDPDFAVPAGEGVARTFSRIAVVPPGKDPAKARRFLENELAFWENVGRAAGELAASPSGDPLVLARMQAMMRVFDDKNVSYLSQRFGAFDYPATVGRFDAADDPVSRQAAGAAYFRAVAGMAAYFRDVLSKRLPLIGQA